MGFFRILWLPSGSIVFLLLPWASLDTLLFGLHSIFLGFFLPSWVSYAFQWLHVASVCDVWHPAASLDDLWFPVACLRRLLASFGFLLLLLSASITTRTLHIIIHSASFVIIAYHALSLLILERHSCTFLAVCSYSVCSSLHLSICVHSTH